VATSFFAGVGRGTDVESCMVRATGARGPGLRCPWWCPPQTAATRTHPIDTESNPRWCSASGQATKPVKRSEQAESTRTADRHRWSGRYL